MKQVVLLTPYYYVSMMPSMFNKRKHIYCKSYSAAFLYLVPSYIASEFSYVALGHPLRNTRASFLHVDHTLFVKLGQLLPCSFAP